MILTEEKAKEKWCPAVRCKATGTTYSPQNCGFQDRNPKHSRCIGSQCMMWNWKNDDEPRKGFCSLGTAISLVEE